MGYSGASYKSFKTLREAEAFLSEPVRPTRRLSLSPLRRPTRVLRTATLLSPSATLHPPSVSSAAHETAPEIAPEPAPAESTRAMSPEVVWTDGACRNNGSAQAIAGVGVFFGPTDTRYPTNDVPSALSITAMSPSL